MKKIFKSAPIIMTILFLIFPCLDLAASIMNLSFIPFNITIIMAILSIVSIVISIGLLKSKSSENKFIRVLSTLALPLSIISGLSFTNHSEDYNYFSLIVFFVFITILCALYGFFFHKVNRALKITLGTISALISLLLFFEVAITAIFGGFSSSTVIKSLNSPDNSYTAEIIHNDSGALGGATVVEIEYNKERYNIYIGEFVKPSEQIYDGEDREFDDMTLQWKNENILLINNKPYQVY